MGKNLMRQNKYEELVREIAEEMARVQYDELFKIFEILPPGTAYTFAELTEGQREMMIGRTIPPARVAVKHMAEEFEAGYNYACTPCDDPDNGGPYIIFGQEERGLLPSPDQPTT